jgi:hypothetical protein
MIGQANKKMSNYLPLKDLCRGVQLGLQYRWLNLQAFLNPPYPLHDVA